ncbi:acyl-CoA dehydrogenase [Oricola thermophila]|uniref:3-methylmercaptopropionyl-CoA dehydrogenase n=1 Tax=Oricola thermophila TaxID=2742145 RepID=A0A6N1VDC0_9HYPH|nr:acyl-CoA dehydrogenase [Oricola thermophila]QKV18906.1 acyl-CoA dehydrogenase [Oricola thermophila]
MYRAPVSEIAHALKSVAGLKEGLDKGLFGDLSEDLVDAILEEAGRFATDRIAPLHVPGDRQGARHADGAVTMPDGYADLYRDWAAGGWNGLAADPEFGGQGLPISLAMAVAEMWNSGSMGFGLVATLTAGAVEALEAHASDEMKAKYLPKMVSGEWTGTMNLTEPQAGSDVGALKARAEPAGDGTYRIFGQKIFITYGEHDMTDNIVHLVLARLPGAPAGTKGISLFLVPKFLVNDDGSLGPRNDVHCHSIEHKLGIHASPTCTMIYGDGKFGDEPGAVGWLVGEENRGLACMFTMMNNARLAVGIEGVAVAEAASQKALAYANERRQGRAPGWTGEGMSPIVLHPDVRRDLLTMTSLTRAARAICLACAHAIDMSRATQGDEARFWHERASLLTPVAKAFSTDIGSQVASIGVQVHGGMGFIEETGAALYMRDARIAQIYEGTNGIQAIDLVTRKLPQSDGACVSAYFDELDGVIGALSASNEPAFGQSAGRLKEAVADLRAATDALGAMMKAGDMARALSGATPYLRLFGLAAGGVYLARAALADAGNGERASLCRFFAENLAGETAALRRTVEAGAESLAAAGEFLVA